MANVYDIGGNPLYTKGLPNTVIVAASNSNENEKQMADYVCDGTNDEVEIQLALNTFSTQSGKVLLCNGDYYIGSFTNSGNSEIGKMGIMVPQTDSKHCVALEGVNVPTRNPSANDWGIVVGATATIHLTDTAYQSLGSAEKCSLIGVKPYNSSTLRKYPYMTFALKNIAINIPDNQKAIIMVDGICASNLQIDHVYCAVVGAYETINNDPNSGCIAIRTVLGQNFGAGYFVKNCFVWGTYVGFDVGGEHLIMEDCGCRLCHYSYRFNGFGDEAKNSHPNTLINCCEEACTASMYFGTSTKNQAISIIDYNMEIRMTEAGGRWARNTLATEQTPGSFRGTVTYSANNENYVNNDAIKFWADGSGINFKTRNLNHRLYGTTAQRPSAPNIMQEYFDTTINKLIVYVGGSWEDSNGNEV